MTSNCDVTKAHTKYKWPPYATEWTPHENFLRTPLSESVGLRENVALTRDERPVTERFEYKAMSGQF